MLMGAIAALASTCLISARRAAKQRTKLFILSSLVMPVGAIDNSIIGEVLDVEARLLAVLVLYNIKLV